MTILISPDNFDVALGIVELGPDVVVVHGISIRVRERSSVAYQHFGALT
jgi:hypothetical protein